MRGTYHFECLNNACDWGVDVDSGSVKEALSKALKLHDNHCRLITRNDPGGSKICPAEHYFVSLPDGKTIEY